MTIMQIKDIELILTNEGLKSYFTSIGILVVKVRHRLKKFLLYM